MDVAMLDTAAAQAHAPQLRALLLDGAAAIWYKTLFLREREGVLPA